MAADDFNDAGKILNEYNLKLTAHAGVTPLRGSKGADRDPMYQAELFCEKLRTWLDARGEYKSRNALTTEPLAPSPDGYPRIRLVATAECMARVAAQFGPQITTQEMTRENVGSKRVIKNPAVINPPDVKPPQT